jgi:hypothetical protein
MFKEVIHSHKIPTSIYFNYFTKNRLRICRNQVSRNYASIFNFKHVWLSKKLERIHGNDPCAMLRGATFYDYIIQIRFIFHKRTGAVARTQHIFIKAEKRS